METQSTLFGAGAGETPPAFNLPAAVSFTVPGDPVGKKRHTMVINRRTGRWDAYTPAETRHYEDYIRTRARNAYGWNDPLENALMVELRIFVRIPPSWSTKKQNAALSGMLRPTTKPDADNVLKSALDGMNKIIFKDDSQVAEIVVRKYYSPEPRLEIMVAPL